MAKLRRPDDCHRRFSAISSPPVTEISTGDWDRRGDDPAIEARGRAQRLPDPLPAQVLGRPLLLLRQTPNFHQGFMDETYQLPQNVLEAQHHPILSTPLQWNQMIGAAPPLRLNGVSPQPDVRLTPHYPYNFAPHHQAPHHHHPSRTDHQLPPSSMRKTRATADFRANNLPLARIKKIMKADRDVKMIAAETPVLFSKACEMFIQQLTHRSWAQTECGKRRTLQKSDVAAAISKSEILDFLAGVVTPDEAEAASAPPMAPVGGELVQSTPYVHEDHPSSGSLGHDEAGSQDLTSIQQHQELQQSPCSDLDIEWW